MKSLWLLTKKSISNRKLTFALSLFSLSLSLCLLLLINRTQESARNSFTNTISKTDLIIGTRSSNIQILLYTLFHKGSPINNISYESYEKFSKKDVRVKWTIPISLGDSHRGHRVIGTSPDMFKHYRYQGDKSIEFTQGESFNDVGEVVIGSEVAKNLGYSLGNEILITHGTSESGPVHDHLKFKIVGILKKTFTPLDKAVFVSLESIEAIHLPKYKKGDKLEIKQLTSFLLKAKHRIQTLYIQREVVEYKKEPLMAVIPGVALTQLWEIVSQAEVILQIVTWFVALVSFVGLLISLYTTLNERRREMAILRAVGFRASKIFMLLLAEAFSIATLSCLFGFLLAVIVSQTLSPLLSENLGVELTMSYLKPAELFFAGIYIAGGICVGLFPAYMAYKNSLNDGLTIRV